MKPVFRAAAALSLAFSASAASAPGMLLQTNHPAIRKVACFEGSGSAFRVGSGAYISVQHVTRLTACMIDGEPITVTHSDPELDFSTIRVTRYGTGFTIDCAGFRRGRLYLAVGHARGAERQTIVPLSFTGQYLPDGKAVLHGPSTVIPGQSGGPILDAETKQPVGTVNSFHPVLGFSASRELRDTPYCRRPHA